MREIIAQLRKKTGISEKQAREAVEMVAKFIGDKVPLVKPQLKNILRSTR